MDRPVVWLSRVFWLVFWLAALAPFAILVTAEGLAEPIWAARISSWVADGVSGLLLLVAGTLVAVLVVYPPAWPGLRMLWRRWHRRATVDRAKLIGVLQQLEQFETPVGRRDAARMFIDLDLPRIALEHAIRAVKLDPGSLSMRLLYARIALLLREPQEALQQLTAIIEKEPNIAFGDGLLLLARAHRALGNREDALAALDQHTELNGVRRDVALRRAVLLEQLQRPELAEAAWREAAHPPRPGERLDLDQRYARARARVGVFRRAIGMSSMPASENRDLEPPHDREQKDEA